MLSKIITALVLIVIVCITIGFTLANSQSVRLNYFLNIIDLPLSVVILFSAIFGILVTSLILGWKIIKLKCINQQLLRKLNNLAARDAN